MDSIVVITTPGAAKRDFVNTLHERSGGKVALVIIQKPIVRPLWVRIRKFTEKVGLLGLPCELLYACLLRFDTKRREALNILKSRSPVSGARNEYLPKVMYTTNVNGDDVYEAVCTIAPRVMAIWGGLILKPRLLTAAGITVNIHTGYCPYYRGTNCNLHAILNDDLEHIGITLHDAVPLVDAGPIRSIITTRCRGRRPTDFMCELNDRAFNSYIELILALLCGDQIPAVPQDISLGKNYQLKEWTYQKQYRAASTLLFLEYLYNQ